MKISVRLAPTIPALPNDSPCIGVGRELCLGIVDDNENPACVRQNSQRGWI